MSKVLIIEEQTESANRLGFLLQLAGHQCTFAHSVMEAASWLRNCSFLSRRFDLLLLSTLPEPPVLEQLLSEAEQVPGLPVICLQKSGLPDGQQGSPERIIFCSPEGLLQVLHKFLADTNIIGDADSQQA